MARINSKKKVKPAKLIPRAGVTKNPKQTYKCGGPIKKAK